VTRRRVEYAIDTAQLAAAALLLSAGVSLVATADHHGRLLLGAALIAAGLFVDRYPFDTDPPPTHAGHVDTVALVLAGTAIWRWRGECTCDWHGPLREPTPEGMRHAEADVETHLEAPHRAPDASDDRPSPLPDLEDR
jgi:hypothetical protein